MDAWSLSYKGNIYITLIPIQDSILSYDKGLYHIKPSPLIWYSHQCTGFYMERTSVIKESILTKNACFFASKEKEEY